MPATITLSANAVAVLRLRIKGLNMPVTAQRIEAYRELASAGIMALVSDAQSEYQFTQDGWTRRNEILCDAETQIRESEPRLPDRVELSIAARETLRQYLAGDTEVNDRNRPAYRELDKAGILMSVGTFTKGDDCVFRFTYRGWQRRFEFAGITCTPEEL